MSIQRITEDDTLILVNEAGEEIVRIRESVEEGSALIQPTGQLSSEVAHDVEDEFVAMALTCSNVVIDMEQVSYISNAVIRTILDLQHMIDARQGMLILRNLSAEVYQTFEDMGIEDVFMIEGFNEATEG